VPTYVYGVTAADCPAPDRSGVDGAEVRVVEDDGLCALVGTAANDVVEAGRANLMAHSDVLQDVVAARTVVPMRFGTLLPDDEAVRRELLHGRRAELTSLLRAVDDNVELSLKVYYVEDAVLSEILSTNRSIAKLRESIRSLPDDASYFQRIKLGESVAAELARRRTADATALMARLAPLAEASDEAEELPELLVLKGSFLVPRGRVEGFRAAVDDLAGESAGRMIFKLVGPLPPYSFVHFEVQAGAVA
jgi:Gas vesicle synthesis protein GvpL/GvpF